MHSIACECFDRTRGFGKAENEKTRDLFPLWSSFERLACGFVGCRSERNAQARPPDLHALPDARTGEGIPHEPLPHQAEADRDGTLALPDGTADQDLVPESADEIEEGVEGGERDKRAGEEGAGGAGNDEEAAGGEAGEDAAGAAERRTAASATASRCERPRQDAERSSEGGQ